MTSRKEYLNYNVKAALFSRSTTGAKRIRDIVLIIYEMSVELVTVVGDVTT